MDDGDRQAALVHVMRCSTPGADAVPLDYAGPGVGELSASLACVHAWDQTGGWEAAVERWGVDQVRQWVRELVPVEGVSVVAYYGWPDGCEPLVEEGRMVGVRASMVARRPVGWLWKRTPPGPAVATPDRRTSAGRAVARHLVVCGE